MALVSRTQDPVLSNSLFITKNLPSLEFENALSEDEKQLLHLRNNSHAILVTQCALATAIVNILNAAKRYISEHLMSQKDLETDKRNSVTGNGPNVGIIGCGQLGSQISNCLLTIGQVEAKNLHISTRRPESLDHLSQKGVQCYYDNKRLISSVDVVILCVLPSQVSVVAQEIKDAISPSLVILCPFSSFSLHRLHKILGSDNLIPFGIQRSDVAVNSNYNYNVGVVKALESRNIVLGTCPIGVVKEGSMVHTDERVAESLILAVANVCTVHGCSIDQTLDIISKSVFGENEKNKAQNTNLLTSKEFGFNPTMGSHSRAFPHFNLVDSYSKGTLLQKHLQTNQAIQKSFATRYCHIFDDYIYKRTFGHLQ
ncbi:NADP-dependent oxidoreductase domain-containing protein 1 [Biomphalaria glabrata]|nr:NADP-dependent oxidoreductase domain-containing protein 1 [Biomphalaria glabrata]